MRRQLVRGNEYVETEHCRNGWGGKRRRCRRHFILLAISVPGSGATTVSRRSRHQNDNRAKYAKCTKRFYKNMNVHARTRVRGRPKVRGGRYKGITFVSERPNKMTRRPQSFNDFMHKQNFNLKMKIWLNTPFYPTCPFGFYNQTDILTTRYKYNLILCSDKTVAAIEVTRNHSVDKVR